MKVMHVVGKTMKRVKRGWVKGNKPYTYIQVFISMKAMHIAAAA